jgi:hypothetical protein
MSIGNTSANWGKAQVEVTVMGQNTAATGKLFSLSQIKGRTHIT